MGELSRRSVDDKKVTDHHALLPTEEIPVLDNLTEMERLLYKMIVMRMLEAFHSPCIKDQTTAEIEVAGEKCIVIGSTIKSTGWRAVQGKDFSENNDKEKSEESEQTLPLLQEGDTLPNQGVTIKEGKTKPRPLLTDATLLSYMETAGKEAETAEEREAMKDCGLGTPATRDTIIIKLLEKKYVQRNNKNLIPTEKGLQTYEVVKEKSIAKPALTGQWEKLLGEVEHGAFSYDKFIEGVKRYTTTLVTELQQIEANIKSSQQTMQELMPLCPKCKAKKLRLFTKGLGCDKECGFILWKEIASKDIGNANLVKLAETGKTGKIKGFKKKTGGTFDAALKLTKDFKVIFDFEKR